MIAIRLLIFFTLFLGTLGAIDVGFTPPPGWRQLEEKDLPPSVLSMVVGTGNSKIPPSINLGSEPFEGTLKDYLKIVKTINNTQGSEWKNLGSIRTEAGDGNLSQVDVKTEWGEIRMMHVILLRNQKAYILTAAASKDEFPDFYKLFFETLRTLKFETEKN